MNCANHPDVPANVFCRTCGKPLCASCARDVQGVVYCEQCLAERLRDVHPPQPSGPYIPVPPVIPATSVSSGPGPNPALAGILAGFFPFGVGAVYTGQYAKGLAHLVIFTLLVWGESVTHDGGLHTILGLGIAFFFVYQIIDAVKSAHAIRQGLPAPDPFGLANMFGASGAGTFGGGDPFRASAPPVGSANTSGFSATGYAPVPTPQATPSKIPTAAVVLIGLGVLFLLKNTGVFDFNFDRIWPVILIGIGVWLVAVRLGYFGSRHFSVRRGWVAPVVLITIGSLSLIENMGGPEWDRTWPILLLAIGVTKLLERTVTPAASYPPYPPVGVAASAPPAPAAPVVNEANPDEVNRG